MRRMCGIRVAFCAALAGVAFAVARADTADLQRANDAEARGDHRGAIALLTQVLSAQDLAPTQRRAAYVGRGVAHGNNGDFQAAIDDFTAAIALDPKLSDAYFDRALINSDIGNYPAALSDFHAIESVAGNYPSYYYYRGYVYFENRDYERAIADLGVASVSMPTNANVYYSRAKAYDAEGQREQAMADFSTTIQLKPAEASMLYTAYRCRGAEAFALKRYDEAISDFSALMQLSPQDADAAMRRGNVYYAEGRYAQSVADVSRVIRPDSVPGQVFPWPGVVDPTQCFADRIIDQYNSGMKLPGIDPYALVARARAYLKLGRKDEALADYAAAVRAIPPGADDSVADEMEKARK